jgi:hypothetical protein
MTYDLANPREIATRGNEIYERKYRAEYERRYKGKFAAIDLRSEKAYLAEFPEEALSSAKKAAPESTFYLLRVGSSGAFKISRIAHAAHRGI